MKLVLRLPTVSTIAAIAETILQRGGIASFLRRSTSFRWAMATVFWLMRMA